GERIGGERRTIESHRYVAMRATLEQAENEQRAKSDEITKVEVELDTLCGERKRVADQGAFLDGERDRILGMLQRAPGFQELKQLEGDLNRVEDEIREAKEADVEARSILASQTGALD